MQKIRYKINILEYLQQFLLSKPCRSIGRNDGVKFEQFTSVLTKP